MKTMNDDLTLLREYARNNSEPAFTEIVTRHVNLVYSVALRSVYAAHLAEEVTQAVFIILARKADSLSDKTILSGWLCRTARYASANSLTIQRRRQQREREAFMRSQIESPENSTAEMWNEISPLLDSVMERLDRKDHDALVLRFFENKNFAEVGTALGTNENAAKMRVNRALEKLRKIFSKRGVSFTAAIITGAISVDSVQAAPVGLAKTISAAAIAKGAAASTSTLTLIKGVLKIMAWSKAKTAVVAGVAVILTAGTTVITIKQVQTNFKNRQIATVLLEMHHQWATNDYQAKGMPLPAMPDNQRMSACSAGILGAYVAYDYQKNGIEWSRRFHILREDTNATTWTLYEIAVPKDTNLLRMSWRHKLLTINGDP